MARLYNYFFGKKTKKKGKSNKKKSGRSSTSNRKKVKSITTNSKISESASKRRSSQSAPKRINSKSLFNNRAAGNARFFDISSSVTFHYKKLEYLPYTDDQALPRINKAIIRNKMRIGDLFFVGSSYQGRQHYGFGIVIKDIEEFLPKNKDVPQEKLYFIGNDTQRGFYTPLQDEVLPILKENNVKYKDVITSYKKIKKRPWFDSLSFEDPPRLFFEDLSKEEIEYLEDEYKKENIW